MNSLDPLDPTRIVIDMIMHQNDRPSDPPRRMSKAESVLAAVLLIAMVLFVLAMFAIVLLEEK